MKSTILITGLIIGVAVALGFGTNAAAPFSGAGVSRAQQGVSGAPQSASGGQQSEPGGQQNAPNVKTGTALQSKANSPKPSANAKNQNQRTTIGKSNASAKASGPSSYWTEEVDVHDNGNVQTTEFLYDARRGILYAYGEDDFSCANGKPERAGILEGVYAANNQEGRPAGSGYYVVSLNAGQCAAKRSGAYGCKFDAAGNPTQCGAIAVNDATGEVTVAAVN